MSRLPTAEEALKALCEAQGGPLYLGTDWQQRIPEGIELVIEPGVRHCSPIIIVRLAKIDAVSPSSGDLLE